MNDIEAMFGVRDASPELGRQFREAVASRDPAALRRLIIDDHPDVLWGDYTKTLSQEDRDWALSNLQGS